MIGDWWFERNRTEGPREAVFTNSLSFSFILIKYHRSWARGMGNRVFHGRRMQGISGTKHNSAESSEAKVPCLPVSFCYKLLIPRQPGAFAVKYTFHRASSQNATEHSMMPAVVIGT
jgi:hypothetical protein